MFLADHEILSTGRWGNADLVLCRRNGNIWAIKDFSPCPAVVRNTWGRWMVGREYRALKCLQGLSGIPTEPFRMDLFAIGYKYLPGKSLRNAAPGTIPKKFFLDLEQLIGSLHQRHLVHLDVRNRGNILITEAGKPALLDFQSSLNLARVPAGLHPLLMDIDLSGVYKNWIRMCQEPLEASRMTRYIAMKRRRELWVFHGYPLGTKGKRRR